MGIGTGLILFAIGAIMRFALAVSVTGVNIHTVGMILMIVGVVAFVVSLFFLSSWGGFGGSSRHARETTVTPQGTTTVTTENHES